MGIVYLGRDPRLDRLVAIKILPEAFAHDPERLARFEREARLLASVTHPNIAGIYGVEESDGQRFLVLEYVEGETLGHRIARAPLPPEDAADVCRQVAAALEAAHENGVIHRDLKPGNIRLTPAGEVKVVDFGLARGPAGSSSSVDAGLSASPTMPVTAMTGAGLILGTAPYMSPEQARGRAVDRRTDIWSFGCVLYECLTGRPAFGGETVSDVIASILQGEPDWKALPPGTPPHLRTLLERCLVRDPRKRLRDIGEARLLLEGGTASLISGSGITPAVDAARRGRAGFRVLPWALAAAFALAAATFAALWIGGSRSGEPVQRVTLKAPATALPRDAVFVALSPEGTQLVVAVGDSLGGSSLWVRSLDALEGESLARTEDGAQPFWSPDGRYLAFTTNDKLKKVELNGGSPEILCGVTGYGRGGSWGSRGVIAFSAGAEGPIYTVSEDGGAATAVTKLDSSETGHRFPRFLPDGRHFLYAALPGHDDQYDIYIGATDSPRREKLMVADGTPLYVQPGYLIFGRNGRLVVQRFDAGSRRLAGPVIPLRDEPERTQFLGAPSVAGGERGALAYFSRLPLRTRLAWRDRVGRSEPLPVPEGPWSLVFLSPDDRRALVARSTGPRTSDWWLLDLERQSIARMTNAPGGVDRAVWSPDGKRVAFASDRSGRWDLYEKVVDEASPERPILVSGASIKYPSDYIRNGKALLFEQIGEHSGWDIWELPLEGDRTPKPVVASPFNDQNGVLSPDDRWLAYSSNESGRAEIYVQSFPDGKRRRVVSSNGGLFPLWRSDGRELLYLSGGNLAYVTVNEVDGDLRFGPARLSPLSERVVNGAINAGFTRALIVEKTGEARPDNDLTLVLHWRSELKRR